MLVVGYSTQSKQSLSSIRFVIRVLGRFAVQYSPSIVLILAILYEFKDRNKTIVFCFAINMASLGRGH